MSKLKNFFKSVVIMVVGISTPVIYHSHKKDDKSNVKIV